MQRSKSVTLPKEAEAHAPRRPTTGQRSQMKLTRFALLLLFFFGIIIIILILGPFITYRTKPQSNAAVSLEHNNEVELAKAKRQRNRIREFLAEHGHGDPFQRSQNFKVEAKTPIIESTLPPESKEDFELVSSTTTTAEDVISPQIHRHRASFLQDIQLYQPDLEMLKAMRSPILDDAELRERTEMKVKSDDYPPPIKNKNDQDLPAPNLDGPRSSHAATNITPSAAFIRYIKSHSVFIRLLPTAIPPKVDDTLSPQEDYFKNVMYVGGVMGGGPPTNPARQQHGLEGNMGDHNNNEGDDVHWKAHANQRQLLQDRTGPNYARWVDRNPTYKDDDLKRLAQPWIAQREGHNRDQVPQTKSALQHVHLNRLDSTPVQQERSTTLETNDGIQYSPQEEVRRMVLLVPVNNGYIDFALNLLCSLQQVDDHFLDHFGPTIANQTSLADALRSANPGSLTPAHAIVVADTTHNDEQDDRDESEAHSNILTHGDARLLEHLLTALNIKTEAALFPSSETGNHSKRADTFLSDISFTGFLQFDTTADSRMSEKGFAPAKKHAEGLLADGYHTAALHSPANDPVGRGLVFTATDEDAYKTLKGLKLPVFRDPQMPFITKEAAAWGHEDFHELVCSKLIPVIRILKSGVDVVFSDADIAFAKPFLPLLRPLSEVSVQFSIGSCHKVISDNTDLLEETLKKFNTGFYYVKSTPQMIHLMERGYAYCSSGFLTGDQPALNTILKEDTTQRKLARSAVEERLRVMAETAHQRVSAEKISNGTPEGEQQRGALNDALQAVADSRIIFKNSMYRYGFLDNCLCANGCTYFKGLCKDDVYDAKYIKESVRRDDDLQSLIDDIVFGSSHNKKEKAADQRSSFTVPHFAKHALLESSGGVPLHLREALPRSEPVFVHANYLVGKKNKVQHLRKSGLWFDHCIAEYKRKLPLQ